MSGGMRSGPIPAEGDHPACTNEAKRREEGRGDRRDRPEPKAEGLALTAGGPQDPKQEEGSARQGWHCMMRKGWKPNGRDRHRRARFTTARPKGCTKMMKHIDIVLCIV